VPRHVEPVLAQVIQPSCIQPSVVMYGTSTYIHKISPTHFVLFRVHLFSCYYSIYSYIQCSRPRGVYNGAIQGNRNSEYLVHPKATAGRVLVQAYNASIYRQCTTTSAYAYHPRLLLLPVYPKHAVLRVLLPNRHPPHEP
jgi:hypothetical protein